jgi:hypothetical protein
MSCKEQNVKEKSIERVLMGNPKDSLWIPRCKSRVRMLHCYVSLLRRARCHNNSGFMVSQSPRYGWESCLIGRCEECLIRSLRLVSPGE